jgi:hypothetical protein
LYAVGEGKDKKEAITDALNTLASTLSVSISSNYNAKTVVKEGRISSSEGVYVNDVQSNVKQIRISNYELISAESLGFKKYAVLVKSNKQKLFESMLQETKQDFEIILENEKQLEDANGLQRFTFYKEAKSSLVNLPNTLIVMSVLNPSFDGSNFLQSMQEINAKYEKTLASLSFLIQSDDNAQNLKAVIAKGLSAKKLQLKNASGKMHFNVYVKAKIQEANAYGFTLARSEINIVTKDSNGVIVGSNALNLVGQSSQGYNVAKQDLAQKLNALIQKEGIAKIMGLNI